jgi:hypothetical protein
MGQHVTVGQVKIKIKIKVKVKSWRSQQLRMNIKI